MPVVAQEDLDAAAAALRQGEVIAIPTDTVYGIAALADAPKALATVFSAKGRPPDLALPVLVLGAGDLGGLVESWPDAAARLSDAFWPGPLTIVVRALSHVGRRLGGDRVTVGLRAAAHPFVLRLVGEVGPLAVTSANRHGERPATTPREVQEAFRAGGLVSAVVDGGRCDGAPSTVVDCAGDCPRILREGSIDRASIEAVLGAD
jgi:tRNA threonylcarbamoyl adenosine modification protein (Sua5/YciO/YrdC/YwlC family)